MIKRPKRGESEDDLLRYQEEFFASQQVPSVVVKKSKSSERDVVTMEGLSLVFCNFSFFFIVFSSNDAVPYFF